MNLFKMINLPIFIISLAIGIFVTYITIPSTQRIVVYPNPDNIDKLIEQIQYYMENEHERQKVIERCYNYYNENYDNSLLLRDIQLKVE